MKDNDHDMYVVNMARNDVSHYMHWTRTYDDRSDRLMCLHRWNAELDFYCVYPPKEDR